MGYHRVVENFDESSENAIPSMLISASMLEQHIDHLARQFEFLSLDEIGSHLESRRPFRRPAAAITFDDGYGDVYRHAFPILKRKGIPAAVFVVTGLTGGNNIPVHDRLYLLLSRAQRRGVSLTQMLSRLLESGLTKRLSEPLHDTDEPFKVMARLLNGLPYDEIVKLVDRLQVRFPIEPEVLDEMAPLTWDMIEEMHRHGFTIGSHTKTHTLLTREQIIRANAELAESRRKLEARLKAPIHHFAYPDGRFNQLVVEAVHDAGYRFGYGICQFRDSRFPLLTIPRKVLWERACLNAIGKFSPAVMDCQISWAFDHGNRCNHDHVTVNGVARGSRRREPSMERKRSETRQVRLEAVTGTRGVERYGGGQ